MKQTLGLIVRFFQFLWSFRVIKLALVAIIGFIVMFTFSSLLMAVWMFNQPLWEVLNLIIVPLVLAVGGFLLNQAQRRREDERSKQERETDRQIAQNREEETALQQYIDVMRALLIDKNLLTSKEGDPIRDVVKTLTSTALRRLKDGKRNEVILRFLMDAGVSSRVGEEDKIINFVDMDLSGIVLERTNLREANLMGANLEGANLGEAYLWGANLERTNLRGTNLRGANLGEANLRGAYLLRTNLRGANLGEANLMGAYLKDAIYNQNTTWPDDFDPEKAGAWLVEQPSMS